MKSHPKRRWIQRFRDSESFKQLLEENFDKELHRKLMEAPEQLLKTSALENFILDEVRNGKVYKTFSKSKRQLIYSNNKIYIVKKAFDKFEIKTVISLQMGRERKVYIQEFEETSKKFY